MVIEDGWITKKTSIQVCIQMTSDMLLPSPPLQQIIKIKSHLSVLKWVNCPFKTEPPAPRICSDRSQAPSCMDGATTAHLDKQEMLHSSSTCYMVRIAQPCRTCDSKCRSQQLFGLFKEKKNTPGTSRLYRCQCLGESAL